MALGYIEGQKKLKHIEGAWEFDEDDWLLMAMLQDPIFCSELLFTDPLNREYGGAYHVRDYQYVLFRPLSNYEIYACARSVGKALAYTEPVITPEGWTTIGRLKVGDQVYGINGKPIGVTGVFPQGKRQMYEVEFSDETIVYADADHLWTVTCDSWKSRGHRPKTLRTHEIASRKARFKTPITRPVEFAHRSLPVSPWLLGAMLGDGSFTVRSSLGFSGSEVQIVDRVRLEAKLVGSELVYDRNYDYWFKGSALLNKFKDWGLHRVTSSDLFIPEEYLFSSVSQRYELLRGLADADGTVTTAGGIEISSASLQLAEDIRRLILSLGGRARIRRGKAGYKRDGQYVQCKDRFRVTASFRYGAPSPFYLDRKVRLYRERNMERTRDTHWRTIKKIRPTISKDAVCISVDAPDGLFLCRDFVATHNTESLKARAVTHTFKRLGEDLLLTAPELIHLQPLTQAIERRITSTRLTNDFLKKENQRTGIVRSPGFQVDYVDGTKILGRIPHRTGVGLKGNHEPDLMVDEGQDMSDRAYIEAHETLEKDHVDSTGKYDFNYSIYGVHGAGTGGKFQQLASSGEFRTVVVTAIMRPGWSAQEKAAAAAMYGGTNSPDYRRNILGEPGTGSSQFFVTSRLMACLDQDPESKYNQVEYVAQELNAEDVDRQVPDPREVGKLLDLPPNLGQQVYVGMDVGLVTDPTVIIIAAVQAVEGKSRLRILRKIHLWRFRPRQIRECAYRIAIQYGKSLRAFGQDITGLGLPLYQEQEDDEACPDHLKDVTRGYTFNAKLPVAVSEEFTSKQGGQVIDQYGNICKMERDPFTGLERLVTFMTMIEASTRYLRQFVDTSFIQIPFDDKLVADMQGETEQRVRAMGNQQLRKKPNAFHELDALRALAMGYNAAEAEQLVYNKQAAPVLDKAVNMPPPEGMPQHGVGMGMMEPIYG